jgi:hypothetical protein
MLIPTRVFARLILALRTSNEQSGDALVKLAASWVEQDRWYLEALGLALEAGNDYLSTLFDGALW